MMLDESPYSCLSTQIVQHWVNPSVHICFEPILCAHAGTSVTKIGWWWKFLLRKKLPQFENRKSMGNIFTFCSKLLWNKVALNIKPIVKMCVCARVCTCV